MLITSDDSLPPDTTSSTPNEGSNDNSIAQASKALKMAPASSSEATESEPTESRPRNANGTFAPKVGEGADESVLGEELPVDGDELPEDERDEAADGADDQGEGDEEPRVFVLKGESQRGETDIELDVSGLPPEALERLEQLERNGMRGKEFRSAMHKIEKAESDWVELETRLKLDAPGFVLEHIAPADKLKVGSAILLEHWDELSPLIQELWEDPTRRSLVLKEIQEGSRGQSGLIQRQISVQREIAQVNRAISELVPDGTSHADAKAFNAAARTVLADMHDSGTHITPETISATLAPLAARFGFQAQEEVQKAPPSRPKLAVRSATQRTDTGTQVTTTTQQGQRTVPVNGAMSADRFKQAKGIKAVSGPGAGLGAVKRPGPPEGSSIQDASRFLKKAR